MAKREREKQKENSEWPGEQLSGKKVWWLGTPNLHTHPHVNHTFPIVIPREAISHSIFYPPPPLWKFLWLKKSPWNCLWMAPLFKFFLRGKTNGWHWWFKFFPWKHLWMVWWCQFLSGKFDQAQGWYSRLRWIATRLLLIFICFYMCQCL